MNAQSITKLQKLYGFESTQEGINTGQIWHFEGSAGRHAMDLLKAGICLLPTCQHVDYYGNTIPSRYDVKPGTPGSYLNALDYWSRNEEMPVMGDFDEDGNTI